MMKELPNLFDPERPYRRVYGCDVTGRFVKVHTKSNASQFGRVMFRLTASECDSQGKAVPHENGHRIFANHDGTPFVHLVQMEFESSVDVERTLSEERLAFAERVNRIAVEFDAAAAVL